MVRDESKAVASRMDRALVYCVLFIVAECYQEGSGN